jgi:lipopolysaccharide transport system permease protein
MDDGNRKSAVRKEAATTINPFKIAVGIWRDREILYQFTVRNIELRHKGSYLGFVWSVLRPLLTLSVYLFVFAFVYNNRFGSKPNETRLDYGLGVFAGLVIYQVVAEVFATSPAVVISQPNFVTKIVFPLRILPVANAGATVFHFMVSLCLLLAGTAFLGPGLTSSALWLPVILFPLVLMTVGVGWLFAALGVFFRDISQAAEFLSLVLMFTSAVFYSPSKLSPAVWPLLRLNPVLQAISLTRDSLLWGLPINFRHLAYLYLAGLIVFSGGYWVFEKLRPTFADVI